MPLLGSFFGWMVVGVVAGVVARLVVPGRDPGGFAVTLLVGIAGALLGGHLAHALGWRVEQGWDSHLAALVGAVIMLALYRLVLARRIG